MNFLFPIVATIALLAAPGVIFFYIALEKVRRQNAAYLEQKSIAITKLQEVEKKFADLNGKGEEYLRAKDAALKQMAESEKQLSLMEQKVEATEKRMKDWEQQKAENLTATKASIADMIGPISNKILEDHKRETELAKKDSVETTTKLTEKLFENMQAVASKVASLNEQNSETKKTVETVWRALASPAGAGSLAEIGLENSLKNFDLEAGRDYIVQYAVSSNEYGSLRPDAVVFLPQDQVMVIDSKASNSCLKLPMQNWRIRSGSFAETQKTMNDHLNALSKKEYSNAILAMHKEAGRANKLGAIFNVMYLPSENAISHIRRADPDFIEKTHKARIILASPSSLAGLLSVARLNIDLAKQAENQDIIVKTMQDLMDSTINVLGYAEKVGKGLKQAADNFDDFARSVNKRMLPKLRQLITLGVKPNKNKELPGKITSYDIRPSDDMLTIESDAEVLDMKLELLSNGE